MTLTPLDIHNKEFSKSFRGYNRNEVNNFLEKVVKDYEGTIKNNIELKEKLEQLNNKIEHYQNMENTLHNAIVVAQETAEKVKENADKEAELTKEKAKEESERMIKEAKEESDKMISEAKKEVQKIERELHDLKNKAYSYRTKLKSILNTQLEMLEKDSWELAEEMDEKDVDLKDHKESERDLGENDLNEVSISEFDRSYYEVGSTSEENKDNSIEEKDVIKENDKEEEETDKDNEEKSDKKEL
ncbi:DivIVA domain-containing protein [Natranaerofaba carboxydovora]|uniref:DivIVA domain-containing protein n=1 Tax=Natranaerofaba carboxydovora TaxID=2742683 RepID=UPI001F141721|nr:DivIVA domain-containing protein [Natranaerofaba carboxydovora]UMZ73274.1 Septum site-determining protein DivIVA [Natranaerofaba carboxydovora]